MGGESVQREAGLVLILVAIPLAVFGGFGLLGGPREAGAKAPAEARKTTEPEDQFPPDFQERIPVGHRGVTVRGSINPSGDPAAPGTRVDVMRIVPDPDFPGLRRAELVVEDALVLAVVRKKNELPVVALALPLEQAVNLIAIRGTRPLEFKVRKEAKVVE